MAKDTLLCCPTWRPFLEAWNLRLGELVRIGVRLMVAHGFLRGDHVQVRPVAVLPHPQHREGFSVTKVRPEVPATLSVGLRGLIPGKPRAPWSTPRPFRCSPILSHSMIPFYLPSVESENLMVGTVGDSTFGLRPPLEDPRSFVGKVIKDSVYNSDREYCLMAIRIIIRRVLRSSPFVNHVGI